jgi:hypothetical protein
MNKKLREAVSHDIHVISEKFLDEITCSAKFDDFEKLIAKHSIHTCGSNLKTRVDLCVKSNETVSSNASESKFLIKSLGDGGSGKVKMKVKGKKIKSIFVFSMSIF